MIVSFKCECGCENGISYTPPKCGGCGENSNLVLWERAPSLATVDRFELAELSRNPWESYRDLQKDETGDWVLWEDHERILMEAYNENRTLRAENARLIMEHVL